MTKYILFSAQQEKSHFCSIKRMIKHDHEHLIFNIFIF